MDDVMVAEAAAHLEELLTRVENGETIHINRDGKRIAELSGVRRDPNPIRAADLRVITDKMTMSDGDTVTKMRRTARY
jgi:antitoxin (DNA-binding transcriptional repressor) of toxin-antitoxin stability system